MWFRLNRFFFRVWLTLQLSIRFEGRHHEPRVPYVIITNHASAVDIPLVAIALRRPVAFMAKEELMRLRAVRAWIRSVGSFFVHRGTADRSALRAALAALERGWAVCLFAEGTRSGDGRLQPFEEGAAFLALAAGVPVLPVGIAGTHQIMPKGTRFPRRAGVVVRIGAPLPMPPPGEGRHARATRREWTARFHEAVRGLLPPDQHALPTQPAAAAPSPAG